MAPQHSPVVEGQPGFRCQHDGCRGKTIKNVFARYPPERGEVAIESGEIELGTAEHKPKAAQSQLLIELAAEAELFHAPGGEAFVSLPLGDHREVWPIKSQGCRRWAYTRVLPKARETTECAATARRFGSARSEGSI